MSRMRDVPRVEIDFAHRTTAATLLKAGAIATRIDTDGMTKIKRVR